MGLRKSKKKVSNFRRVGVRTKSFANLKGNQCEFKRVCRRCKEDHPLFSHFPVDGDDFAQICFNCIADLAKTCRKEKGEDLYRKKKCKHCGKIKCRYLFPLDRRGDKRDGVLYSTPVCRKCYAVKKRPYLKKVYKKLKKNKKKLKAKRRQERRLIKKYYFSLQLAYTQLKKRAKAEGVKVMSKIQFQNLILKHHFSQLTGRPLRKTKFGYHLDRIGKKEFGGDGKRGGDYVLGNVLVVNPEENFLREALNLTVEVFQELYWDFDEIDLREVMEQNSL